MKPYKSTSPPKVKKQKPFFDFATNIRIDTKSAQGSKRKETAVEHVGSLDLVVKKALKSPASEHKFISYNDALKNESGTGKNRLVESIDFPTKIDDSPKRVLNKYDSDMHVTFAK